MIEKIIKKNKIQKEISLWLATLLSAILYSLSFVFLSSLGFLVIFSIFFLFYIFLRKNSITCLRYSNFFFIFNLGLIWGIIVFGLHFVWLLQLLLFKSKASILLSFFLYLIVVFFFSIYSSIWFFITYFINTFLVRKIILRIFCFLSTSFFYFFFIENWSLWFLGRVEGYPFVSPLIPLSSYRWFLQIVFFVTTFFYNFGFDENFDLLKKPLIPAVNICYVKPLCNKSKRALDQLIFHQIGKHTLKHNNNNKFCIMVAPESTYPFCLNKHCDIVSFWSSALKKNDSFFVGSLFKNTDKSLHQAVFWIHNGKIVDWHTKKHYVPFVEIMPSFLQKVFVLKNMFLQNKQAFSYDYKNLKRTNIKNKEFDVCSELKIIPKLCSEFFFKSRISDFNSYRNINKSINRNRARKKDKKRDRKQVKVFFFINDSWFIDYFRKILKNSAYLMSAKIGLPVLYVGHFDCKEYSL